MAVQNLRGRIAKLEKRAGIDANPGQLIIVKSSSETDEGLRELLLEYGIDGDDPKHQIAVLRTLCEDRNGNIEPPRSPVRLLYTRPL